MEWRDPDGPYPKAWRGPDGSYPREWRPGGPDWPKDWREPIAPSFDFFVNSVNGSDSNDGLTKETAFQTLSALTLAEGAKVALIGGSHFRETFDANTLSGVQLIGVGTPLPIIDGSDPVPGPWTAHATLSNVWEYEGWAHDSTGENRLRIFKDGELLTRVEGEASALNADGQFLDIKGSDGTPLTLTIYSTTDPNLDEYEATARDRVVWMGDNARVEGIQPQRAINDSGPLSLGVNATVRRVLPVDGTKHNLYVGSGLVEDVIAYRNDPPTTYEAFNNLFVTHTGGSHDGKSITYRRCMAILNPAGGTGNGAYTQHSGSGTIDQNTNEQVVTVGCNSAFGANGDAIAARGSYIKDAKTITFLSDNGLIEGLLFNTTEGASGMLTLSIGSGDVMLVKDSVFFIPVGGTSGSNWLVQNSSYNGADVGFQNSILWNSVAGNLMTTSGRTSGTLRVNGCILLGTRQIHCGSGVTLDSDNNVFVKRTNGTIDISYNGTIYTTLASFQAASGTNANSIEITQAEAAGLFSGTVANGDWRLAETGAGALARAIGAGPQQYWDYSQRMFVTGAPLQWPTPPDPTSLTEMQTYVANPAAWDWYA